MKHTIRALLSFLLVANSAPGFAAGKIQNEDVKSLSELTAAGGTGSQLINDSKIWMTSVQPAQQLSSAVTAGLIGGGGGGSGRNFLSDPSFEAYPTSSVWTVATATGAADTVNETDGAQSARLTFSGTTGNILQDVTPAVQLQGVNMQATCFVRTLQSNVQMCARVGGSDVNCQAVPASNVWTPVTSTFVGPSSGSIGVKVQATSAITGTVNVDQCYLGKSINTSQLAQATYVGGVSMTGATSCTYTTTTSTFATFAAVAACNNSTATGSLSAPSAKQIGFSGTLAPGVYLINANLNNLDSAAAAHGFRLIAGSTTSTEFRYQFRDATTSSYQPNAFFTLTLTQPYTGDVLLQGLTSGGGTLSVLNNTANLRLGMEVFRFPLSAEAGYRPDAVPASWSGYQTVAGGWATSSTTYADFSSGTTPVTTQLQNRNFGTVATATGNLPGLLVNFPRQGLYQICASGNYTNGSVATASLRLVDGSGTVITQGQSFPSLSASTQVPFTVCGNYNAAATAATIIKLNGLTNAGTATIGNGAGTGTPALSWTILELDAPMAAPFFQGNVTSQSTGSERIERASITNNGTATVASQSGSWVSSATRTAAGFVTVNFAAGTFSSTPTCICQSNGGNGEIFSTNSTSASSVVCQNVGASTDRPFALICMGPR